MTKLLERFYIRGILQCFADICIVTRNSSGKVCQFAFTYFGVTEGQLTIDDRSVLFGGEIAPGTVQRNDVGTMLDERTYDVNADEVQIHQV
mmetsp:Transcript_17090/g.28935  ORF Transcript_17090/g.28935 Transcript_17090/m.28935 type:complete len:91 (-) Transcript_17090:202-474(-)